MVVRCFIAALQVTLLIRDFSRMLMRSLLVRRHRVVGVSLITLKWQLARWLLARMNLFATVLLAALTRRLVRLLVARR